jgi:hypothetical protein
MIMKAMVRRVRKCFISSPSSSSSPSSPSLDKFVNV